MMETVMKRKILLSMFTTALAATTLPAAADNWLADQLARTDGYSTPADTTEPDLGAAGRVGHQPPDGTWLERQMQLTDGYADSAAVAPSLAGPQGRAGRFQEPDTWLDRQLEMTDGSNAAQLPVGSGASGKI